MGRINKYNIAEAALLVVAAYLGWWLWQTYGLAMSIVIITSALLLFIGCLFLAEYYSTKDRDLLPPAGLVFTGLAPHIFFATARWPRAGTARSYTRGHLAPLPRRLREPLGKCWCMNREAPSARAG